MSKIPAVFYGQFGRRHWPVLALFTTLTVVMLYPLSVHLLSMVPEPTDPLLNVWRMQWNVHAFLGGPAQLADIFNANIFYPFPLTLAYSEHFLMMSMQALPLLLLTDSHMFGMNLSVLVTFVLSGYAMYLLITVWTGSRWAGLLAGLLFAFAPQRFGQLNHLELLVTQWLPLALLALHWTLTRSGWRFPALFILFFNVQALSNFHYTLNLTIACGLLVLVYGAARRIHWRPGLWGAAGLAVSVTLLLNWPIWRQYLRFSELMGAVRAPGEVRMYSAALTDYLTAIPHNRLYGWTFGHWPVAGHQLQPLMPFGLTGVALALAALAVWKSRSAGRAAPVFALLLALGGLLLSFGLNDAALGAGGAALLKYSPYFWLYDHVSIFRGIRVPGRFGILALLGLAGLAGWGAAAILRRAASLRAKLAVTGALAALILLESWSAPLVGPQFLAGQAIPPVYAWLRQQTPPDSVILELPHRDASEFLYEYYSTHHWRKLANGGTGYTPPVYKNMRQWFLTFPDARSVDVIQQMGIDWVVLHADMYPPADWQRLLTELSRYWPAIAEIHQIDRDLALRIAQPECRAAPAEISVAFAPATLDGLPNALAVSYANAGSAAFVADVRQVSQLNFADGRQQNFTEPLVTPAGEKQQVVVPSLTADNLAGAWLATLGQTVAANAPPPAPLDLPAAGPWQPLGLRFAAGPQLAAYRAAADTPAACGQLLWQLKWAGGQTGDTALAQLLDPLGRVVAENATRPWDTGAAEADTHRLALPGSTPPGRYGLRVVVAAADGSPRQPLTGEGVPIPADRIPPLPVVIQPATPVITATAPALAEFANGLTLRSVAVAQPQAQPGDWLRFSLVWQAARPLAADLTVFTQLLGPDGRVWGQQDSPPGGGWYNTPLWLPERPVADAHAFQIAPDAPPGVYQLIAGWYNSATQERLPLVGGGDFVKIGEITVGNRPATDGASK